MKENVNIIWDKIYRIIGVDAKRRNYNKTANLAKRLSFQILQIENIQIKILYLFRNISNLTFQNFHH